MAKKSASKNKKKKDADVFTGIGLFLTALIVSLSFIINADGHNLLGPFGELISRLLYLLVGKAAYVVPFVIVFFAFNHLKKSDAENEAGILLGFAALTAGTAILLSLIFTKPESEIFRLGRVEFFQGGSLKELWAGMPQYLR
ncbi:MAG: DNA translocase FtsK 4TM domain-containing protein, partial [Spirochaetia bacterium]|nr:DNA translocase FtsK 4TM domain-containing protein [Spirochaetia bacterium]